jgi:hypothetical protein
MTALLLGWLLAADPAPSDVLSQPVERAGITGTATVTPVPVPLTGTVRLALTIEATAPLAVEPVAFTTPPGWRVRDTEAPALADRPGGRQRWQQTFRLAPERPGDLPLPPPAVHVRPAGRETPVVIDWKPLTVRVTTSLPRVDLDEARGVTGPEPAPEPPPSTAREWLTAAGVVAGLVVTLLVAWRRLRRPQPAPEPAPHVWALAELDRLAGRGAADPAAADALADLLRGFLARRYQLAATGQTTAELLAQLRRAPLPPETLASWHALLGRCDLARFARVGFTPEEWPAVLQQVRDLVAASVPVGEPAGAAQAGGVGEMA